MTAPARKGLSSACIHWMVTASGLATLSWEVLWQIRSSLALGVSAWGTAITLATTMGGMSLGSLAMSRWLQHRAPERPVRIYGALEIVIGCAGLLLGAAFTAIENLDTLVYAQTPQYAPFLHILAIAAALGVPTICMGATLPVFGLMSRQYKTSIAELYSLNTLGAAAGTLIAAFFLIPDFGLAHTACIVAALNMAIGIAAWLLTPGTAAEHRTAHADTAKHAPSLTPAMEQCLVLVTGFATFTLEVAWFRSLTAALFSTTDAFAIMLASVLIALGVSANIVPLLRQKLRLGPVIAAAGVLILLTTPVIERFDLIPAYRTENIFIFISYWFAVTFLVIGPPVFLLGVAFPWILNEQHTPRRWGTLYALNTLAAIIGSLAAGWLLLPNVGFARTAWIVGALVTAAGILTTENARRIVWGAAGAAALIVAVVFESGIGRTHVQGHLVYQHSLPSKILEFFEGPEATVSAVEYDNGARMLVVDGFLTAAQLGGTSKKEHYMAWMGHLPMLLTPAPKNALVICFGTGQTANAVRRENPQSLDIVDINPRVFKLAHNFSANDKVLEDARVKTTVMDGRAYMRRSTKTYDVITLEPMPPNFAGVNALYSTEFYELAKQRLSATGVIAQWVPLQLVAPHYAASIVRTFQSVFPNAILWVDPFSETGILLGSPDGKTQLGASWPGFARTHITREHPEDKIKKAVLMNAAQLQKYGADGEVITDDNQLLAYGSAVNAVELPHLSDKHYTWSDKGAAAQ